jgi:hypothetical protein
MRAFASRTRVSSRCSDVPSSGRPEANVSAASRDATSPACAPPIPSATTNSGARTKKLSSFARR